MSYNRNKLYHSDRYLGQDFSDGIRHYKYLRKVRTAGGGWRYIYDESEMKTEQAKINALKKTRDGLSGKDGYLTYTDKHGNRVSKHKDGHSMVTYGVDKQTKKDKAKETLVTKIDTLSKKHAKQKIKDIPKRAISKGIAGISNLIYKTKKKRVK